VTTAGESNAEPGVTVVKRSASRASTRLEYQKLVIMPRMMNINALTSSKQGQSLTGDGWWLTRGR
jgi:hypothetical protein